MPYPMGSLGWSTLGKMAYELLYRVFYTVGDSFAVAWLSPG